MTNKQGIVAALLATTAFASPAFAQSTDTQTAPEPPVAAATPTSIDDGQSDAIVVTGIRGSQEKSIDLKREATAIVDEISAERSEEHTSEIQSLMSNSYAVFWLKKQKTITQQQNITVIIKVEATRY